jgi:4-coumarate--CoA ligase
METFLQTIHEEKITFVYVAPPVIVRLAKDKMVDNYDLSSIRAMTCGAAPLTKELVETVHKRLNIEVNQAYGLSETSPVTHAQVSYMPYQEKSPNTHTRHSPGTNGTAPWAP